MKSKGEKERYKHLNAKFQRIARRDKKAFPSDQSKEIEENNRMGKTRDLFKKIRDTKGTFHAKMGTIKDRNSMDLTKQKILRGGNDTQKNYTKKTLVTQKQPDYNVWHLGAALITFLTAPCGPASEPHFFKGGSHISGVKQPMESEPQMHPEHK